MKTETLLKEYTCINQQTIVKPTTEYIQVKLADVLVRYKELSTKKEKKNYSKWLLGYFHVHVQRTEVQYMHYNSYKI